MKSSQAAIDLIIAEEDSDQAYYNKHYTHMEWPGGASGATVGIGYDLGQCTRAEIVKDWTGIVSDQTIAGLLAAQGLQGERAHQYVRQHGASVTITWEQAIGEFDNREIVKWEAHVAGALPNTDALSPDSFGALVSLAYNRGYGGFSASGPRYAEMRAIKAHMAAKEFAKIPGEFLAMRRLWPQGGGLWRRRMREANLFAKGLAA